MRFMAAIESIYIQSERKENGRFDELEYRISQTGDYPCFCTRMKNKYGYDADHKYISIIMDEPEPLCKNQMMYSEVFGKA